MLKSSDSVNKHLLAKINKTVRKLGVESKSQFGVKPIVKKLDLVDLAVSAGTFGTLVSAITAAGLVDALKAPGPFTVFAPSEEAFAKLGNIDELLADKEKLAVLLKLHVSPVFYKGRKIAKQNGEKIDTLAGQQLAIKVGKQDGVVTLDTAKVIQTDLRAANGMIHVIDTVLTVK